MLSVQFVHVVAVHFDIHVYILMWVAREIYM